MKKLVMNIPIKTISEFKLKKVIGPMIVRAIAVMIHKIIIGGLKFNLVKYFSHIGPDITPKDPANNATRPYWSPILVCSHP